MTAARESDDALVGRIAEGDSGAWAALIARHLGRIHRAAWYMLGDRAEAEDVAQETFLRLSDKIGEWRPGGAALSTWLHRVAINLCIDRRRRKRPEAIDEIAEQEDPGGRTVESDLDRTRQVRAAIDALNDRQRAAIVLVHYQGLSNREAAKALGIGIDALESLLSRARRALRATLAPIASDLLGD